MKIDLTCPVELWQYAMPTEDDAECTFMMNNLSDKVVTSVQVTLACYDAEDMLLFRQTERIQGIKAGVGERFSILLLPTQWQNVEGVDLIVEKVWFEDATIWRRSNAPLTSYTSNALPNGRALDQLRFVAGKDAVGYPQEQEQVWLCVCGRANAKDSQRCCRCERRRESVFASYTRENVDMCVAAHESKLAELAKKAREENSALAEAREKSRLVAHRRHAKLVRLLLSGLCLIAVIAVFVIWGIPTIRYNNALNMQRGGKFDDARAAFAAMGEYRDAENQLTRCDYLEAESYLNAGDEESLALARDAFKKLGDFEQSRVKWQQSVYELGQAALEQKRYEDAADMFQQLGDYEDSERRLSEATYLQACALLEGESYRVAGVLFESLGDYEDSAAKALECVYREGKAAFDAEDYETAIDKLSTLGDYDEAERMTLEANYMLGEKNLAAGELLKAGEYYLAAGAHENAADKANDCLYQYAQGLAAGGEWEAASRVFARITGYLDSEGQVALCLYRQARASADAGDYAAASALLSTIARDDDAAALYNECNYKLAMQAAEAGDDERAERLLADAGDYEDSEKQLQTIRYRLAEGDFTSGDFASALTCFEELGAYRDSRDRADECAYQMAAKKLADGDYSAAIDAFGALHGYKDSAGQLAEATYQLALQRLNGGDQSAAIGLLETIPEHAQAAKTLRDIVMAEAKKLADAGDYEGAGNLYLTLSDDAEAREGYSACRYAQASALAESGENAAACAAYTELGGYLDSAARAEECADKAYGAAASAARDAWAASDYAAVIAALDGVPTESLPQSYSDLAEIYREACYQYAEKLYGEDKPYEALPYYARITDYKDVADKKLKRRAYLILGEWESATGKTASFRADGTCDLMGEKLCFRLSNFSLYTGKTREDMTVTHRLNKLDAETMGIRDEREGGTSYKLTKVAEAEIDTTVPVENTAPATDEAEEMLVAED